MLHIATLCQDLLNLFGYSIRERGSLSPPDDGSYKWKLSVDEEWSFLLQRKTDCCVERSDLFRLNVPPDIRKDDIQFGRNFTAVRKSFTNNDLNPLEMIR